MKTRCPLCGKTFDTEESDRCKACPSFMKCGMTLCPNCGYEFPAEATKR